MLQLILLGVVRDKLKMSIEYPLIFTVLNFIKCKLLSYVNLQRNNLGGFDQI